MSPEQKQWLLRTAAIWVLDGLYTVSPIDLIPDAIPFLGQADDVFFFALAIFFTWRTYKATGKLPTAIPSEHALRHEVEDALGVAGRPGPRVIAEVQDPVEEDPER